MLSYGRLDNNDCQFSFSLFHSLLNLASMGQISIQLLVHTETCYNRFSLLLPEILHPALRILIRTSTRVTKFTIPILTKPSYGTHLNSEQRCFQTPRV